MTTKKARTKPLWDKVRQVEARAREAKRVPVVEIQERAWVVRILGRKS